MGKQIEDGRGEIVVGVHQPGASDDSVPVRVGIVAERDIEPILEPDQPGHREPRRAVHADPAVPIDRHERERRIELLIHDLDPQPVPLGDRVPEGEARAPERVDADAEACAANGTDVDDRGEIAHVRPDVVVSMRCPRLARPLERDARHALCAGRQQRVRPVLDPAGDPGVGGAAGRRVVLETPVLRRVVRRSNDDAVGQPGGPVAVVRENGVRDRRRGRTSPLVVDYRQDAVAGQHLQRRHECRHRQGVRVPPEIERPVDALACSVIADRLRDCQHVRFVERAGQRRAAVAARAEAHALRRIRGGVGTKIIVRVH
jgi:hypothetical protein